MPPKQIKLVHPVQDREHFAQITAADNTKLNVIDLHMNFFGPCKTIENNYRALYFAFENAEDRLAFWSCSEECAP